MCVDFQMRFRHSEGNLHIHASGGFDGESARELLALFRSEYRAGGRVFVDTVGLNDIQPSGRIMLDSELNRTQVPPASLFFKGEKGFQVAPSGSRVIVMSRKARKRGIPADAADTPAPEKHTCCGKCAHCTCHGHGHDHTSHHGEKA